MEATEFHGGSAEEELRQECEELRARNRELMEAINAIRLGEVDAIVVAQGDQPQVYALEGADHPYRVLVERIQEGALTLSTEGMILYANAAFAEMRRLPLQAIFGTPLRGHFAPRDRARLAPRWATASSA
jgi:PAS domain-containing protein